MSFDFDSERPTLTVEAGYSKHRRRDVLPLYSGLVAPLRAWIDSKHRETLAITQGNTDRLWPGTWREKSAKMLRADLEAAGIPYEDADGRVFDFHALRGQFITMLGRQGVTLQEVQKLARHSDPRLTANIYTHLTVSDLGAALDALPNVAEASCAAARATGTDDAKAASLSASLLKACSKLAQRMILGAIR